MRQAHLDERQIAQQVSAAQEHVAEFARKRLGPAVTTRSRRGGEHQRNAQRQLELQANREVTHWIVPRIA